MKKLIYNRLRYIFIMCCLLATLLCFGQGEDQIIDINLKPSKSWVFSVKNSQTSADIDEPVMEVEYEMEITVTQKFEYGYHLALVFQNYHIKESINEMYGAMVKALEGMKIEYAVDKNGSFVEIMNWERITEYVDTLIDKFTSEGDQMDRLFIEQISLLLKDKEKAQSSLFPEIRYLHAIYGKPYNIDHITKGSTGIQNTLGVDFPAKYTVEVKNPNQIKDDLILEMTINMDEEEGKKVIMESIIALAEQMSEEIPSEEELSFDFSIEETYLLSINKKTGTLKTANIVIKNKFDDVDMTTNYQFIVK